MLNTIKNVITIVSLVGIIGTGIWGYNKKQEAETYYNNYQQEKTEWKDEKGRLVSQMSELKSSTKELKAVAKQDSAELSETRKQLKEASETIKELNIELEDVKNYYKGELSVLNDSLVSTFEKDEKGQITGLKPIKTEHLDINFVVVPNDTVLVNHKYTADIVVVNHRKEIKTTKSGNRRFFLARWLFPRYKYWATTRVDDPNAELDIEVVYNFGN